MPKLYDTGVIFTMRVLLVFTLIMMATTMVYAAVPLPSQKPKTGNDFDKIIEAVSKIEKPLPRAPRPQASLDTISIIIPPPLPNQKIVRRALPQDSARIVNGKPIPNTKPLSVRATAQNVETIPLSPIPSRGGVLNFDDDRTASRAVRSHAMDNTIERTHSKERERLRTTNEKSPFKTAQLPRVKNVTGNDPIIIFFKENSSELEVGQLDVIKSDIINRLRRAPSRKVAVYGYAERNRNNPDRSQKLSLSRALLISEFLADNRIAPNRIEARAMGHDTPISPKNRVDVVIF